MVQLNELDGRLDQRTIQHRNNPLEVVTELELFDQERLIAGRPRRRHASSADAATNESGHQANAAARFQVHVGNVSRVDELVVHKHPGALGLAGLLGKVGLGHHGFGVTGWVGNLDHEGRGVLTTNAPFED